MKVPASGGKLGAGHGDDDFGVGPDLHVYDPDEAGHPGRTRPPGSLRCREWRRGSGRRPHRERSARGGRATEAPDGERWLDKYLLPTLGDLPLDEITPSVILRWYEDALPHDKPKTTRECYAVGSAIMRTATAADGVLAGAVNPFKIDGAGSMGSRSRARTEVIDDHDLQVIMSTIRPEWRAMVALALGCGLRFGEIIALRRSDIDLTASSPIVRVTRAVGTGPGGRRYEKDPKSAAGKRDQQIPASAVDALTEHLRTYVTGRDGLLFPAPVGGWLSETRFRKASGGWLAVRDAVGRPINFHDLRATGATRMAQRGTHVDESGCGGGAGSNPGSSAVDRPPRAGSTSNSGAPTHLGSRRPDDVETVGHH